MSVLEGVPGGILVVLLAGPVAWTAWIDPSLASRGRCWFCLRGPSLVSDR